MNKPDEHKNALGQPIGAPVPDWDDCPRPPRSPMSGTTCRLEPLDPNAHADSLYEAFAEDTDGKNWTYMGYGPFSSLEAFRAWLETDGIGDDPQFYAVIESKTEQAVGVASYVRIEPATGVIEVGHIHFSPRLQRTKMATEAMYLMMCRVFDELGYRRYEWKCDALNAASRKAAWRFGFSFEGIFRQATMYKGRNRDTAWFSIIDSEWPLLKKAYQAWLDPTNFDADGQQRRCLVDCMDLL